MAELRVFYGNGGAGEWVIAADPADADGVYAEHMGQAYVPGDDEPTEWRPLPENEPLTISNDEDGSRESKTCGEWAAQGRGFLCTGNF